MTHKDGKIRVHRHSGRPRKYTLPLSAYEEAVRRYRTNRKRGRPRREIHDHGHDKMLQCIECRKWLPVTKFWFSDTRKLYFESMCQSCKRKYARERKR